MMESSRLILKNLPNSMNEQKLRTHLDSSLTHLEVTDISLKLDAKGKSRRFAFVGFKSDEEAREAKEKLDNAFVGTSKIKAEFALDIRAEKQRKSREHEERSSTQGRSKKEAESTKVDDGALSKFKGDEKFEEFLKVHKKKVKDTNKDVEEDEDNEDDVGKKDSVSDLDFLKSKVVEMDEEEESKEEDKGTKKKKKEPKNLQLFTLKLSNLPYKAKKKEVKMFFKPLKVDSIRVPRKVKGIAYAAFKTEDAMKKAQKKNGSFMGEHRISVKKYSSQSAADSTDEKQSKWSAQNNSVSAESVSESGRLFIRNLAYTVTEDEVEELFKPYGLLTEVHLPLDPIGRRIKGFGFVQFALPENAVQACNELDGSSLQGRLLHIMPAKAKDEEEDEDSSKESSFKKQKLKKQRQQASMSHNWNSLFLGANAVADVAADKYDVDKEQVLLDGDKKSKESAAVKLALAETQIVMETKTFLEEQGVHLDAFNDTKAPRSKTIILAKNLGVSTASEVLRNLFSKHGRLARVVLPPQGVTALIEFEQPAEARAAFKALAYKRLGSAPLYLEWAPLGALKKKIDEDNEDKNIETPSTKNTSKVGEDGENSSRSDGGSTLFVKNLNFATNEAALKSHFEGIIGTLEKAIVARKSDGLSMGYGFVKFKSDGDANEALKQLQHSMLDDHSLELSRSTSLTPSAPAMKRKSSGSSNKTCSKLLVRNVAFEATSKELRSLFAPFGQLKEVRLPKKATGGHRGFAFVDYESKEQAKSALESLGNSTHLYGRRLVLAYSEDDDDSLEAMQRQAALRFADDQMGKGTGRVKKAKIMEDLEMAAHEESIK